MADKACVLIVDDEQTVCWSLGRALSGNGRDVATAASAEEGLALCEQQRPDVVLLDVRLPGMSGVEALQKFRQLDSQLPVIVMTAYGDLDTAVGVVRDGAFDYVAKPFDLDEALRLVDRALRHRQTLAELKDSAPTQATFSDELVGRSPAMQEAFKRVALASQSDASVVIRGESGVGKELVARAIHRFSSRNDGPFLPVHVASLNSSLIESELFGHVKGAFTGATVDRLGLFTLADGGTVFLDEIGEIPLGVQVKLLRLVEQREALPVGGMTPQRLDVRLLAATYRNLETMVRAGTFRHDLYYRVAVFDIEIPPLRERIEDILPLAEHFLRRVAPAAPPIPPETVRWLESHPWHGNGRELRNALEHAAILSRQGPLLPEHFPRLSSQILAEPAKSADEELQQALRLWCQAKLDNAGGEKVENLYATMLSQIEPVLLEEVIRRVHGNRWAAAEQLGLNRATVRKRLRAYGLEDRA